MRRLMIALFTATSAVLIASSAPTAAQFHAVSEREQLVIELSAPALSQNLSAKPVRQSSQASPFSVFDWGVCGLDEFSTIDDARAKLGECVRSYCGSSENDITCEYAWGSLDFSASEAGKQPLLRAAVIKTDELSALRGLKVGGSFESALALFPSEGKREYCGGRVLYCGDPYATTGTPTPPCAVARSRGGFESLVLAAPIAPLNDGDIVCSSYYVCRLQSVNKKITAISFSIVSGGALADCLSME